VVLPDFIPILGYLDELAWLRHLLGEADGDEVRRVVDLSPKQGLQWPA